MASPEERAPRFPGNNSTEAGINNLTCRIKTNRTFFQLKHPSTRNIEDQEVTIYGKLAK